MRRKRSEEDGWYLDRTRGNHRQYQPVTKPGAVTIAEKPSEDVDRGTRASMFRQARLPEP